MTAKEKKKSPLSEMPFGVVPQFVLRDKKLSRPARLTYAIICSFADEKGLARVAMKTLAIDMGVTERSIHNWILELEIAGLIVKENDIGKISVFRVIRFKKERNAAQRKNLVTVCWTNRGSPLMKIIKPPTPVNLPGHFA